MNIKTVANYFEEKSISTLLFSFSKKKKWFPKILFGSYHDLQRKDNNESEIGKQMSKRVNNSISLAHSCVLSIQCLTCKSTNILNFLNYYLNKKII